MRKRTFGRHPENRTLHRHVLVVLIDVACVPSRRSEPADFRQRARPRLTALLRSAKVRDFAHAVLVDENVVGFHVAVQDAQVVQVLEAVEDLEREETNDVFLELQGGVRSVAVRMVKRVLGAHLAVRPNDASDRATGHVFEEDGQKFGSLLHACSIGVKSQFQVTSA